jgi:hypothetical protein
MWVYSGISLDVAREWWEISGGPASWLRYMVFACRVQQSRTVGKHTKAARALDVEWWIGNLGMMG